MSKFSAKSFKIHEDGDEKRLKNVFLTHSVAVSEILFFSLAHRMRLLNIKISKMFSHFHIKNLNEEIKLGIL